METTAKTRHVTVGNVTLGNDLPLVIIAGPCQMESRQHALDMSGALKEIAGKLGVGLIYKTSYDKANRTSVNSARGLGLGVEGQPHARLQQRPRRCHARSHAPPSASTL